MRLSPGNFLFMGQPIGRILRPSSKRFEALSSLMNCGNSLWEASLHNDSNKTSLYARFLQNFLASYIQIGNKRNCTILELQTQAS